MGGGEGRVRRTALPETVENLRVSRPGGQSAGGRELFLRLLVCPEEQKPIITLLQDGLPTHPACERLAQELPAVLRQLEAEQPIPLTVGQYRRRCRDLARYSFHTAASPCL